MDNGETRSSWQKLFYVHVNFCLKVIMMVQSSMGQCYMQVLALHYACFAKTGHK